MQEKMIINQVIQEFSFNDFYWVEPDKIPVSQWVRIKCQYGCTNYGKKEICPPNVPSLKECKQFFNEYELSILIQMKTPHYKTPNYKKWCKNTNSELLSLEKTLFLAGYFKTFLFTMSECQICLKCTGSSISCMSRSEARPSLRSFGVDIYNMGKELGYDIEMQQEDDIEMMRYALLLIR